MSEDADLDVLVIGAGFAGLCAAIKLRETGASFVVLERGDAIGGTWRDNRYPGCACDVQSHLYSYSFEPNPDWTRMFAQQAEIWAYLERCADKYGVRPHVRLGENVVGAVWDGGRWTVTTAAGHAWRARVLISAMGALSNPGIPEIPGMDRFEGERFHSATWRDDVDLTGKRVAVIGTGASAIQFVPQIAPKVARLDLYQRTPPWIIAKPDRAITGLERWLFRRLPLVQRLQRWRIFWELEARVLGFAVDPRLMALVGRLARRHLAAQVPDPELRRALTPDYAPGCKRILISDDYYPALCRPNVEVITTPLREAGPRGLITADGRERDVDVVIYGTGFAVQDLAPRGLFRGRDGQDLAAVWKERPEAYKGTAVAGFPNLFFLVGPNTGLGHSSMLLMIESQVAYVIDALRQMRESGWRAVEVRAEAQHRFNDDLRTRLGGAVWQAGCRSWYLDDRGRNIVIWPGSTLRFRRITARFDSEAYTTG